MMIIVDIDGTLADCTHRLHHVKSLPQHWDLFYAGMSDDKPIQPVIRIVKDLWRSSSIFMLTGRPEKYRQATEAWLRKYYVPYHRLYMRADSDFSPSPVFKLAVVNYLRESDGIEIDLAIEDEQSIADIFAANGITTLIVNKANK